MNKERDKWFIDILDNLYLGVYDIDDGRKVYKNSDGEWMIISHNDGWFWLSYDRICLILSNKYGMKYDDIKHYIKTMFLKHTNWDVLLIITTL